MRFLLIALIGFLTLSAVFNFDPGPMPGIKIKNALLYAIIIAPVPAHDVSALSHSAAGDVDLWGVLVGYSLLTYAAIVLVIDYPRYDWLQSGLYLKNALVDYMLLFLVFFYGLRSTEDAIVLLKVLLACWALSHIVAVLDALGFVRIGDIEMRRDGRVQGTVGESNQYGVLVALSLPAMAAAIFTTRGMWRIFWMAAAAITALTLIMTVSRGAFVGTAFAALLALYLFRRYVRPTKLVMAVAGSLAAAVLAVAGAFSLGFGDLLYRRMLGSAVESTDLGGLSSGRTIIWAERRGDDARASADAADGLRLECLLSDAVPLGHAQPLSVGMVQSWTARARLQRAAAGGADQGGAIGVTGRERGDSSAPDGIRRRHDGPGRGRVLRESLFALVVCLGVRRHRDAHCGERSGAAGDRTRERPRSCCARQPRSRSSRLERHHVTLTCPQLRLISLRPAFERALSAPCASTAVTAK